MKYSYSEKQYKAMEGLAYWAQEEAWTLERFGEGCDDLPRLHDSVRMSADECTRLKVPGWVINEVCSFGRDWRRYMSTYLDLYLNRRNVTRRAAGQEG